MRTITCLRLSACALALSMGNAFAQYPDKAVTVVVPYATGGGYDRIARLVTPILSERLGQTFLVVNRGGAGGTIGMSSVAKAAPDGYTLVVAGMGDLAIAPSLYNKLPYDAQKDFAPIAMMATFSLVLGVHPKMPVKSVAELIAMAKANPGKISFASSSVGSTGHLSAELFKSMAGIELLHVPYKGTGPALTDLMGGQVNMMFTEFGSVLPNVKAGRVNALAVSTPTRSKDLPSVPTMSESGLPGFEVTGWWGLFAPAGTPPAIINRLHSEVVAAMSRPDLRERLATVAAEPATLSLDRFRTQIQEDVVKFQRAVKASGIKLDL